MINSYKNITTAATTLVKTGEGSLHSIAINETVASATITIYDGLTAATGTLIGTITNPGTLIESQLSLLYDVSFGVGLTIVTTGTQDITVAYK